MRALASMETTKKTTPIESTEGPAAAAANPATASLARDPGTHQSMLNDHAQRLRQLEQRQSLFSFPTHDIAQVLLLRLSNGDKLESRMHGQLQTKLSEGEDTQPTPAPTGSTRAGSTMTSTSVEESRSKPDRSMPLKRKSDTYAEEEPPVKRQRGCPPNRSASDTSNIPPPPKRLRGRPPTHGRYSRKSSYGPTSSSCASVREPSKTPSRTSVPSRSPIKKKGIATKKTAKKPKPTWRMEEVTWSEAGESRKSNSDLGSTGSVDIGEKSDSTTPRRAARPLDGAKSPLGPSGSDEPIAVIPRTQSMVTPKSKSVSCGISSDEPSKPKPPSSPGYRDLQTPELAAMEETTADGLAIPPERRSGRKTNTPQHYGNPVPWREANVLVNTLRSSAP